MDVNEIIKLLDILIGTTEAVGDAAVDKHVEKNLMKLIDITNWCLDGIAQSSETRHRFEASMRKIGQRAFSAMDEYKSWLTERLESEENE